MHGAAEVGFSRFDGGTRVTRLFQRAPLRVLMPSGGDAGVPTAVLLTTSGGLVGGDRLDVAVTVDADASAVVTQQAAEKVYRSLGPTCRVAVDLAAGRGAWLEWLPQETILFDGARLERRTTITVEPGARLLAGELLVFGRHARGETLSNGFVHDGWEVRRDGRLVWADALRLDGEHIAAPLAHPACLAGAAAVATMVYAEDQAASTLDAARTLAADVADTATRIVATVVGGVLIARFSGGDALRLRTAFARFWSTWRQHVGGLTPALPRVWFV